MEDLIPIEGCAIPACTLRGVPWYSQAHFTSLTDDHLVPHTPERIFLARGVKGEKRGQPCVVFGLRYTPAVGIPELDDYVFQSGAVAEAPEFMLKVHALERNAYSRLAVPDDVIIHLAVQDLRERVVKHVERANNAFVSAFSRAALSESWLKRQAPGPCAWAAAFLFSTLKTVAQSGGRV